MNRKNKKNKVRKFLNQEIQIKTWDDIKGYFQELVERKVENQEDEKQWLADRSELDAFTSEDFAWRYINFTRNTQDEKIREHYQYFVNNIQPQIASYDDQLNKKLLSFSIIQYPDEERFQILKKLLEKDITLFRKKNIPIFTEISNLAEKFSSIASNMTVDIDGEELTLQQASNFLEDQNREFRKIVFEKIITRRTEDNEALDELYTRLITLRDQVAKNAGKDNFRDYMFEARGRFDYSIEDNLQLHDSIRDEIVPVLREFHKKRQKQLELDILKPYDLNVDPAGGERLIPYKNGKDLIKKSINCFKAVDPVLGNYLKNHG